MRTSGFDTSRRFFVDTVQVWRIVSELFYLCPCSESWQIVCDLFLVQCLAAFSLEKVLEIRECGHILFSISSNFFLCCWGWEDNWISCCSVLVKWSRKSRNHNGGLWGEIFLQIFLDFCFISFSFIITI